MRNTLLTIYSLLLAIGVLLLGSGLLGTLLGLRAGLEGYSAALIGVIMAAFFFGYVVGSYVCPPLVARIGHIRAFAAMAAVAAASVIVHGLIVDPWVWWALRIVTGVCMLGLYLVAESWLNAQVPQHLRGRIFAVYMTVNLVALGAGQFLLLLYGARGLESFALVALFTALALVPVALTRTAQPEPVAVPRLGLHVLYRMSPLGMLGTFVSGLCSGAFWGMGAVFAQRIGMSDAGVVGFVSAVVLGGALLQWPIGHFSDARDRRGVLLAVSLAGAAAAAAAFMLADISRTALVVSALLYGGFSFALYPLAVAHTNDQIEAGDVLSATRGLLLLSGVGASVGPLLAGAVMQLMGPRFLLAYFAVLLLVLAAFATYRGRVGRPGVPEAQTEFVPMARTSAAVLELDPRAAAQTGHQAG
jgi:MFS family permease